MGILRNKFNTPAGIQLFEFTQGIDLDTHLAREEIAVQLAWAQELADLKFLSATELGDAQKYLQQALEEILSERFEWKIEDEDIHMNLERYLTEKAGELGKKIHFGRSRNDLIATTLRLFCARVSGDFTVLVKKLIKTLAFKAEKSIDSLIPGQTHLQHGQPIRESQFWLAHAQSLLRDVELLEFSKKRALNTLPLGSGALSGVSLAVPLEKLATKLGFSEAPQNSYDSVADRDFILDLLRALSSVALHLSRLSEDIIFYSSSAVGLFKLPKDYSTGSSMMPNKRNPDVAELTRAKASHIMSASNNAYMLIKALPMSYNSDLHELKRVLMNSLEQSAQILKIFPPFVEGMQTDATVALELLKKGAVLATYVAENKVFEGQSFRTAYTETAQAISDNAPAFDTSKPQFLNEVKQAIEAKNNSGGISEAQIKIQISNIKSKIKELL